MKVSLSPSANYVTQQKVWSNHILGKLSDRRIAFYQEQGYYGQEARLRRLEAKQRRKRSAQRSRVESLLARLEAMYES